MGIYGLREGDGVSGGGIEVYSEPAGAKAATGCIPEFTGEHEVAENIDHAVDYNGGAGSVGDGRKEMTAQLTGDIGIPGVAVEVGVEQEQLTCGMAPGPGGIIGIKRSAARYAPCVAARHADVLVKQKGIGLRIDARGEP